MGGVLNLFSGALQQVYSGSGVLWLWLGHSSLERLAQYSFLPVRSTLLHTARKAFHILWSVLLLLGGSPKWKMEREFEIDLDVGEARDSCHIICDRVTLRRAWQVPLALARLIVIRSLYPL